jgi:3-hydroxyisobutyrate dehydrogenase-like beta-hydroxyacid dehydrogenase
VLVRIGEVGAGQVAKACNQMVLVAAIEACAEAARLAEAAGVDFALVRQAMLGGSAGSRVLDVFGGRMAARDFAAGVEARLHHKDYALLMDEATRIGAPLPVSAAVWQQLNAADGAGLGHAGYGVPAARAGGGRAAMNRAPTVIAPKKACSSSTRSSRTRPSASCLPTTAS